MQNFISAQANIASTAYAYIYIYMYIYINIILKSAATNAVGITMCIMGPLDCNFLEN
jgi:hypothetical protein